MIYVTGDCHGNFRRFQPEYFPEQAGMTKNDVVIITGDFGGVWFGDSRDDETLDWLESLPFTVAFVDGNHENFDALAALIDHLQHFLLELGRGSSFVARQKKFTLDGQIFFIDLVFYNYILKCFVLIDLKM